MTSNASPTPAQTAPEILEAAARRLWYLAHRDDQAERDRCPPSMIPTPEALAAWLPECPHTTWRELYPRLTALDFDFIADPGEPERPMTAGDDLAMSAAFVTLGHGQPIKWDGDTLALAILDVHTVRTIENKRHGPHPAVLLVEAWQEAQPVTADTRRQSILPLSFKNAFLFEARAHDRLPTELSQAIMGQQPAPAQLPLFEDAPRVNGLVPVLPLRLYELANSGRKEPGRGAPKPQRLFFEALLSVGRLDRVPGKTAVLRVKLQDLAAWLWPKGWNRSRDLPKLIRALIELHNMRVSWQRSQWALVLVLALPNNRTALHDDVVLRVEHLPGSERGALIDREALRHLGQVSAPAWRILLRLAYLWDEANKRNNGRRIYATRPEVERGPAGQILGPDGLPLRRKDGRPIADWRHGTRTGRTERNPRADLVPEFGPEELIQLAFDEASDLDKGTRRQRLHLARKALTFLEGEGLIVRERGGYGSERILEAWRDPYQAEA